VAAAYAHFQREYPDEAPDGLQPKIDDWAAVMIRRSDNLWDFRRLDDAGGWTPMGEQPQMWNEPGNVTGFPASLIAAREFASPHLQPRIDELVWSHLDNFSGRNPVGRHFCFRAPAEIEGVEYGWFSRHPGGIGRLVEARFVIDGAPKNGHYPHNPGIGNVVVDSGQGDIERITVTETGPSTGIFVGRVGLEPGAGPQPGDGILQVRPGASVRVSHGFGYLGRCAGIDLDEGSPAP
jgi:hypothetical protein